MVELSRPSSGGSARSAMPHKCKAPVVIPTKADAVEDAAFIGSAARCRGRGRERWRRTRPARPRPRAAGAPASPPRREPDGGKRGYRISVPGRGHSHQAEHPANAITIGKGHRQQPDRRRPQLRAPQSDPTPSPRCDRAPIWDAREAADETAGLGPPRIMAASLRSAKAASTPRGNRIGG